MNDDTSNVNLPAIPDLAALAEIDADTPLMIEEYILQRTELARQWLDHAQTLMTDGEGADPNAVLLAICAANDNLIALADLKPGFAGFVAGVEAGIAELVRQRDALATAYDQLEAEMEARVQREVSREVPEVVAQLFATDEDAEEAEIDMLARDMVQGDEEEIVSDAIRQLARKLSRARELAQEYRASGLPDETYTEEFADGEEMDEADE